MISVTIFHLYSGAKLFECIACIHLRMDGMWGNIYSCVYGAIKVTYF